MGDARGPEILKAYIEDSGLDLAGLVGRRLLLARLLLDLPQADPRLADLAINFPALGEGMIIYRDFHLNVLTRQLDLPTAGRQILLTDPPYRLFLPLIVNAEQTVPNRILRKALSPSARSSRGQLHTIIYRLRDAIGDEKIDYEQGKRPDWIYIHNDFGGYRLHY